MTQRKHDTNVNRMHNTNIDAKTENCVTNQKCTS